jgi:hypothetical protein
MAPKPVGTIRQGAVFVFEGRRYKVVEVDQRPTCAWISRGKVHIKTNDGGNTLCFERNAIVEII